MRRSALVAVALGVGLSLPGVLAAAQDDATPWPGAATPLAEGVAVETLGLSPVEDERTVALTRVTLEPGVATTAIPDDLAVDSVLLTVQEGTVVLRFTGAGPGTPAAASPAAGVVADDVLADAIVQTAGCVAGQNCLEPIARAEQVVLEPGDSIFLDGVPFDVEAAEGATISATVVGGDNIIFAARCGICPRPCDGLCDRAGGAARDPRLSSF